MKTMDKRLLHQLDIECVARDKAEARVKELETRVRVFEKILGDAADECGELEARVEVLEARLAAIDPYNLTAPGKMLDPFAKGTKNDLST